MNGVFAPLRRDQIRQPRAKCSRVPEVLAVLKVLEVVSFCHPERSASIKDHDRMMIGAESKDPRIYK
jgi:hypothetical protein